MGVWALDSWARTMLNRVGGNVVGGDPVRGHGEPAGIVSGPTLRLERDGERYEDVLDEIVGALDEGLSGGPRLNRQRARERDRRSEGLSRREDGIMVYNGRTCCLQMVEEVHRTMHTMDLNSGKTRVKCTGCGSLYRLVVAHREQ